MENALEAKSHNVIPLHSVMPKDKAVDIEAKINASIDRIVQSFNYTKDNLLCFSVSTQPHFLVWSAALALHEQITEFTREVALENAREELFGLESEGSHALLSYSFFRQIGEFESKHYNKAKDEVLEIYKYMSNHKIILTCLTCMELNSSRNMSDILKIMEALGATDFQYIDVHKIADNLADGHSMKFLKALELEDPTLEELTKGISLFENLFLKIFE